MTPESLSQPPAEAGPREFPRDFHPEDFGFPPPLTRARGLARNRSYQELCEKYPGRYVAFLETWTGDEVRHEVVAAAAPAAEYRRLLGALAPDVRSRVDQMLTPEPDVIEVPSVELG